MHFVYLIICNSLSLSFCFFFYLKVLFFIVLLIWITRIFAGLDGTQRREMRSVGKGTQTVECQEAELKQE